VATPVRSSHESLHLDGAALPINLGQFWQWMGSDLLNNTLRGMLAEFIVGQAIHAAEQVRDPWQAFDLHAASGARVEVKSCAHRQTWKQKRPSAIRFSIGPTREWNPETGEYQSAARRQADVYVFCVLENEKPDPRDPLELNRWSFYVLATCVLNERCPKQKSIGLKSLLRLNPIKCSFPELAGVVEVARRVRLP